LLAVDLDFLDTRAAWRVFSGSNESMKVDGWHRQRLF
jgi:hypothetical protein